MKKYNCIACDFHTNLKGDFKRHLQRKKHVESTKSQHLVNQKSTFSQPFLTQKNMVSNEYNSPSFQCHYCLKYFKFKQSLYKHIKYTCKKNKDEDFKELARLLNEKEDEYEKSQKQLDAMKKQIDKLTNKLQIQNINKGTINNVHNMNVQLLNFTDTDYSHLTDSDYKRCINECNHCVKALIEHVHFNKKKPENMNIYISNIKGTYAMIYNRNKWQIVNKKDQIDDLFDYNEVVLENWYDEYKQKYPEIIKSFNRYLSNKDKSDVINDVKKKIILMLYNNREMIQDTDYENKIIELLPFHE